ncbi:hypothetical protein BJX64DRAFT_272131 [Aspergillus heterothallicus]
MSSGLRRFKMQEYTRILRDVQETEDGQRLNIRYICISDQNQPRNHLRSQQRTTGGWVSRRYIFSRLLLLGRELRKFGHRVRLYTHATFRDLAVGHGLEFFCIGGDPAELMAYIHGPRSWAHPQPSDIPKRVSQQAPTHHKQHSPRMLEVLFRAGDRAGDGSPQPPPMYVGFMSDCPGLLGAVGDPLNGLNRVI